MDGLELDAAFCFGFLMVLRPVCFALALVDAVALAIADPHSRSMCSAVIRGTGLQANKIEIGQLSRIYYGSISCGKSNNASKAMMLGCILV